VETAMKKIEELATKEALNKSDKKDEPKADKR
jgi:hypothetical protein